MSHPAFIRLSLTSLEDRDVPSATLDLTQRGSQGGVNGGLFRQYDARPTGTGVIESFVRVQAQGNKSVEQGYNTDARPLQYDENKSPQFTRSMKVADLPLVNVGGTLYREVLLDINQKASASQLSLDELRVYVGEAGNLTGYNSTTHQLAGLDPVYDLDGAGDAWVKLDARLNTGSGSGDMLFYVPLKAVGSDGYVYLYSKFGATIAANGGFEEWAAGVGGASVTPDTASFSGIIIGPGPDGPDHVSGGWLYVYGSDGREIDVVLVGDDGTFAVNNFELLGTGEPVSLVYVSGNPNTPGLAPDYSSLTLNAGDHLTGVTLRLVGA